VQLFTVRRGKFTFTNLLPIFYLFAGSQQSYGNAKVAILYCGLSRLLALMGFFAARLCYYFYISRVKVKLSATFMWSSSALGSTINRKSIHKYVKLHYVHRHRVKCMQIDRQTNWTLRANHAGQVCSGAEISLEVPQHNKLAQQILPGRKSRISLRQLVV